MRDPQKLDLSFLISQKELDYVIVITERSKILSKTRAKSDALVFDRCISWGKPINFSLFEYS